MGQTVSTALSIQVGELRAAAHEIGLKVRGSNPFYIGPWAFLVFGGSARANWDTLFGENLIGCWIDEVHKLQRQAVDLCLSRSRVGHRQLNIMTSNATAPNHWFKTDFVDNPKYPRFTDIVDNNPGIADNVKRRYHEMFSGVFHRRYVMHEYIAGEGLIYPTHTTTEPHEYQRYTIAIDPGYSNTFAALLIGRCIKCAAWHCADEYYYQQGKRGPRTPEQHFDAIERKFADYSPVTQVVVDSADSGFYNILRYKGWQPRYANKDVLRGIQATDYALSHGKVLIDANCRELLGELSGYVWDDKASERGEDKPVKSNDHLADCLRYFIMLEMPRPHTPQSGWQNDGLDEWYEITRQSRP